MYAAIDTETGGFSKTKNAIVEMAIVIANAKKEIIARHSFVLKPYFRRDPPDEYASYKDDAMDIHGIKMDEIERGHSAEFVGSELSQLFIEHKVKFVIGHNIKTFDGPWWNEFLDRFGPVNLKALPGEYIDTLTMCRQDKSFAGNKLGDACKHFGIAHESAHRALGDAEACFNLWLAIHTPE